MTTLCEVTAQIPVFNEKMVKKPFLCKNAFLKGALGLIVAIMIMIDDKRQINGLPRST